MPENRPNILLMMSDQHSPHFLGCYGNDLVRTPNLDRLAAGGMRFTEAHCASPLCVPSRMSFMTSRTPSRNRVWSNTHVLSSAIPTWAHYVGAAGYETALIGRMHFVGTDHRHGFELRPLGEYAARHPGTPEKGGNRWKQIPGKASGQNRTAVEVAGTGTTSYQHFDEQVAAACCDYLRERSGRDGGGRPFAAVAGFLLPHCPFVAPKDLFEYYYDKVDIPVREDALPATVERYQRFRGILDPLPEERIRVARAAYFAMCEYFDRQIGKVLDCLDETGLAENTLVIYTSDHGEQAGEHGCWWKSSYYRGSVGVPMIARLGGRIPAGASSAAICNLMDVGPTLCEAGGAEEMRAVDGRSLLSVMCGRDPGEGFRETFSELVDSRTAGSDLVNLPSRMIRSERWKLWRFGDPEGLPPALFDVAADPGETRDLGEDPEYADVRERLLARLHRDWDPAFAGAESARLDEDLLALGAWGKAVMPEFGETLPVPPSELQDDVKLL